MARRPRHHEVSLAERQRQQRAARRRSLERAGLRPPERAETPPISPRRQVSVTTVSTVRIDAGDMFELIRETMAEFEAEVRRRRHCGVDMTAAQPPAPEKPRTAERVVYPWAHLLPARVCGYDYVLLTSREQMIAQGRALGNCLAGVAGCYFEAYWRDITNGTQVLADFRPPGGRWAGTADIAIPKCRVVVEGRNSGFPPRKVMRAAFELSQEIYRALARWKGPRVIVQRVPVERESGGDQVK